MTTHPIRSSILSTLVLPLALFASDSSSIKAPLHGTGDPDATGVAVATLKPKKSELILKAANLLPSHPYAIEVAGIVEGTTTTDQNGKASAKFANPAKSNTQLLDFDPRGEALRLLDGATPVLEGVISGRSEDNGVVVNEKADLTPEAAPLKAKASARYTVSIKGRRTFRVEATGLTGGPFKILVAGIERGELVLKGTRGQALFDSAPARPGVLLLDFDPRGAVVDLADGATVLFTGKLEAKANGVNTAPPSESRVAITSTGVDADGTATAKLRIDSRARKHFSVELEDVAVGAYELLADGVLVGTIQVAAVTGGTKGELEFTNGDDDPAELPLTFDPVGKLLTVAQGGTKFFESLFDPNVTGAGTPGSEPPSQFDELLASTGLDADAKAEARYEVTVEGRHKFSVEIEDVAVGAYTLTIGGVVRGTLSAKLVAGKVKGELEFESKLEPGHKLLNFDPRGQTIELSDVSGVFFAHLFGSGTAGGAGGTVTPFDVTVALTSSGTDADATAQAEFRRDVNGDLSFEVELEDLAAGSYDLLVGGTLRGAISVVTAGHGTRGKLKFDSDPKVGESLLNFVVAGQEILVQQGATIYFSRTFPTP